MKDTDSILTKWNSIPKSPKTTKNQPRYTEIVLYSCKALLTHMNFIKSSTRNRLGLDISNACVNLRTTNYEPCIKTLTNKMQQQISHKRGK